VSGALLAAACGDALGAPVEFQDQSYVRNHYGTLRDMVGGGGFGWAPGEWTDDTGMALCVGEGIVENADDPVEAIGRRFLTWRRDAKDVGNTIASVLTRYSGDWAKASSGSPAARAGKAAGNGSLMRTLPVALAYANRDEMWRQSARISALTHWDAQAEICCAIYCTWVQELLGGLPFDDALRSALESCRELAGRGQLSPDTPGSAPLPSGFWTRLERMATRKLCDVQPTGYAGYVVDCLEAAVVCCMRATSLEEAIVSAVNLAGESDTIATVAGGVAGAHWGVDAIPSRWLKVLHQRDRIEALASALLALPHSHPGDAR
jgi:ADP-ribosyl-[dinitrogen reductase] hydrolase